MKAEESAAGQYRKPWILEEPFIVKGSLAQIEGRAAIRAYDASAIATPAQADGIARVGWDRLLVHIYS